MPIEEDVVDNNTPSETGGYTAGNDPNAPTNLDTRAKQLAKVIGVSPAEARDLITAYAAQEGISITDAATKIAHNGAGVVEASNGSGDSSGTGGGGSSSSGSGGSSVAAGPSPQDLRNAAASYRAILTSWGLAPSKKLDQLVAAAVKGGVSTQAFVEQARTTKDYAARFPGIMRGDGTMRMTESQYISGYESARDAARTLGRNLPPGLYGLAIKNGNSPSEIKDKLSAIDTVKQYGPMFEGFNGYLMETGVIKKPLTKQEAARFVMGEAPKQFYAAYRTAQAAATVEELGFDVGKDGDVNYKDLNKIAAQMEVMGQQGDYTGVLAVSKQVLGEGDFLSMGVTRKDQVKMALGAPGAKDAAAKVTSAVNMRVAALTEQRANPNIVQAQGGGTQVIGGRPQAPQSE